MNAEAVVAYLAARGVVANMRPGGNCMVVDDGAGPYIKSWNVPGVPQPTPEDLAAADLAVLERQRVAALKAAYTRAKENLHTSDPKLALVYDMIATLCLTKLGMTPEEFDTTCKLVWDTAAEKGVKY